MIYMTKQADMVRFDSDDVLKCFMGYKSTRKERTNICQALSQWKWDIGWLKWWQNNTWVQYGFTPFPTKLSTKMQYSNRQSTCWTYSEWNMAASLQHKIIGYPLVVE